MSHAPNPDHAARKRRAWSRARQIAQRPTLPDRGAEPKGTLFLVLLIRGSRRLLARVLEDGIQPRAAALSFHTLLAIVPVLAVAFGLIDAFGGDAAPAAVVKFLAERYFPSITADAVNAIVPLVESANFEAVGLIGVIALLPVMIAVVSQVEIALADIFRTRRPKRLRRILAYAVLVTVAPVGTVLTVRYTPPHLDPLGLLDRYGGPTVALWLILYLVFRFLPGTRVRNRAALGGAALSSIGLVFGKALFGFYAVRLAHAVHVVWGAIAFVPLVLLWVFVAWCIVLLGAEVAAVIQEIIEAVEAPRASRRRRHRPRSWQDRRQRRLLRAVADAGTRSGGTADVSGR